jgi:hypothetical protein
MKMNDVWGVVGDALVIAETLRCDEDSLPALFIKTTLLFIETMFISEPSDTILFRVYYATINVEF